jgi:drug/metabolite transporter (DMT)-like permease
MKSNTKAHLAVLTANFIYGANYSIAKFVMPAYIKPFAFISIRVITATLLFWMISIFTPKEKVERNDKIKFFYCAVFGVAINQLLFFKGLSLTSPINSGLIMVISPVFVLVFSALILRERIPFKRIVGVLSALAGAFVLIKYAGRNVHVQTSVTGDLCILFNAISFSIYLVMAKPLMKKYSPYTLMKYVFLFGAFMVFPFSFKELQQIDLASFTPQIWWATAFVVIGTTFLAYLFNTLALQTLSPGVVSVYIYLQPVLAAGIAILLGKDSLSIIHIISAVFIFMGVYFSTHTSVKEGQ